MCIAKHTIHKVSLALVRMWTRLLWQELPVSFRLTKNNRIWKVGNPEAQLMKSVSAQCWSMVHPGSTLIHGFSQKFNLAKHKQWMLRLSSHCLIYLELISQQDKANSCIYLWSQIQQPYRLISHSHILKTHPCCSIYHPGCVCSPFARLPLLFLNLQVSDVIEFPAYPQNHLSSERSQWKNKNAQNMPGHDNSHLKKRHLDQQSCCLSYVTQT